MATHAIYLKYLKLLPCLLHESDFVCVHRFDGVRHSMHLHFNEDISLEDVRCVALPCFWFSLLFFLLLSLSLILSTRVRVVCVVVAWNKFFFCSLLLRSSVYCLTENLCDSCANVHYSSSVCRTAILISHKVRCIHTWLLKIAHKFTQGYFLCNSLPFSMQPKSKH